MSRRPLALAAAVTFAGACGGDDDGHAAAADAAAADAPAPDARACAPLADPPWLMPYQTEVVEKLAGAAEIAPGVTLVDRQSVAARDATRAYLLAELSAHGYADAALAPYESGANVVARLPATGGAAGAPLVVVGAHFDGIAGAPAAGDNATGVAIVLAAARHLRELPCRDRELVFVLFDQEELGLIGSGFFAEALVSGGAEVVAVHSYDLVSVDADGDQAIELWSPPPALLARYQAAGAARGVPVRSVSFAASDHASFQALGFAAVGVSEEFVSGDANPYYHTPEDTAANIDFAYLAQSTRLFFDVLAAEAQAAP